MLYHSHYSNKTSLPYGKYPSFQDILARAQLIHQAGIRPIDEKWIPGQGTTLVLEGPTVDEDIQNLLCIKELQKGVPIPKSCEVI